MPDEELERSRKQYFQDKNLETDIGGVMVAWLLPGALAVVFQWDWMLTWWGFCFVGLPYLAGLIWSARAHRLGKLDND